MNKTELIEVVSEKTGLTKNDSTKALSAIIEAITEEMSNGGAVSLVGFGTFTTGSRAARTGRNPITGESIKIEAAISQKFKAGKALKEAVNNPKKKSKKK